KPIPVDVRIIADTHRNLEQMVDEGKFREDLYYRLSVIPVNIPPLRERCEDITYLIDHFIKIGRRQQKKMLTGFDLAAMQALREYSWKGNVRELENLIQHMTILHGGKEIHFCDLPDKYRNGLPPPALEESPEIASADVSVPEQLLLFSRDEMPAATIWDDDGVDFKGLDNKLETQLIIKALQATKGNKKEAARLLNLKRTTLLEKIKKKELQWEDR
ncbi:MAG TPA: sigma-54-dependent Fis family transcriptional regulator, partial [Desulfobulbaceae bacterium]|nr:sigma-54-dependent Fis family transcriptional regulator [Desulfobulbaceae bacterium]